MLLSCLEFSTLVKRMAVNHTVLQDGHVPNVALNMLAVICGTKAKQLEMSCSRKTAREGPWHS